MNDKNGLLVSVVGPTAVGKTSFGISLAQHFGTEVVSVDSRQFYREMEIGTAKPSKEERSLVPHHFVDNLSIHDSYTVGMFETEVIQLLDELFLKHDVVIAAGGSGLFFKAIWEGFDEMPMVKEGLRDELNQAFKSNGLTPLTEELKLKDPKYYEEVDLKNHQRVIRALEVIRTTGKPFSSFRVKKVKERPFRNLKLGISMDRDILNERIDLRMDEMISQGLFEEAEKLHVDRNLTALQTVGYTEIFDYLEGKYDKEEAIRLLKRNSRRYAKRQMTWFNACEDVIWLHPEDINQAIDNINVELAKF
ncbi:tRNA (adenosine(37)-N6)-dimethylallyltransferase MiaA [Marinoscillum sp. MHG1-6]|uniref:tRNA (adenosine(37)-N6)-dimethylallyltransferase MiaA n=1 Tax=Marinoscillum sp. MHG1-6 TaxID=2959627 RepID=UPI002157C441|nr:tRNA (adenosine(37)-N6)-dimethylallyltransferase MiaA [Marinoscillum sp. MHG1-6]